MTSLLARTALHLLRIASLILLAAIGTISLMRLAPGYFTETAELNAQYATQARSRIQIQQTQESSLLTLSQHLLRGWLVGNLGRSRHYDVPVTDLLLPRLYVTARLLLGSVGCGWLLAFSCALLLSARQTRSGEVLIAALTAILLAIPIGAMATACLMRNTGGPLLVLTTVISVRDFKLLYKLFRAARCSPHLVYARAQGISAHRIAFVHLLFPLTRELFAVAMVSLVTALSSIVPVEVVFDVPGLGHLAWSAAMNRDLPVLLAVTLLMATAVGITSFAIDPTRPQEAH